jgi:hypothetical protein
VSTDLIVILGIGRKNLPQMRLAKDQHAIQTLASHGANQTLYIYIFLWRYRRDLSRSADQMRMGFSVRTPTSRNSIVLLYDNQIVSTIAQASLIRTT